LSAPWSELREPSCLRVTRTLVPVIAATRNENVKALVYVATLAPNEGETVTAAFSVARHRKPSGCVFTFSAPW
jgi:hypothetical protein